MFHAPIPPSFIHCPNETSRRANGMPTTTELIKNGMRNAPKIKEKTKPVAMNVSSSQRDIFVYQISVYSPPPDV